MATRRTPHTRHGGMRFKITTRRLLACAGLLVALLLAGRAVVASLPREAPPRPLAVPTLDTATPTAAATPAPTALASATPSTAASADDGALALAGAPSVSARMIDAVLAREGSPLVGQGAGIVAQGRRDGIDPVFLLAFVSHFDLRDPLPAAAHNVGHIRASGGAPALGGYRVYPTWRDGIAAWYTLIHDQYVVRWGLKTLDAIVPVYAPSTHAGVEGELADLRAMVVAWRASDH